MAGYLLSNKAVEDISNIWSYSVEAWSEVQADKYYRMLLNTFESIAGQPDLGRTYDELGVGLRGVVAGKHIVFHRVLHQNSVEIVRILHRRMDLKRRLS